MLLASRLDMHGRPQERGLSPSTSALAASWSSSSSSGLSLSVSAHQPWVSSLAAHGFGGLAVGSALFLIIELSQPQEATIVPLETLRPTALIDPSPRRRGTTAISAQRTTGTRRLAVVADRRLEGADWVGKRALPLGAQSAQSGPMKCSVAAARGALKVCAEQLKRPHLWQNHHDGLELDHERI